MEFPVVDRERVEKEEEGSEECETRASLHASNRVLGFRVIVGEIYYELLPSFLFPCERHVNMRKIFKNRCIVNDVPRIVAMSCCTKKNEQRMIEIWKREREREREVKVIARRGVAFHARFLIDVLSCTFAAGSY